MQLVRSLYISSERTYTRKIREAKLAEELEDEHSKEWILEKYLDSIPYGTVGGQSAIGIKAAAKIYFSKDAQGPDAARGGAARRPAAGADDLLADAQQGGRQGAPQRGAAQDGRARHDHATRRRSTRSARNLGIKRSQFFTRRREEYFFDYVKDQLFQEYGAQTVRQGGMKVYTTIDLHKQEEARDTIADHLAGIGPSSAIVTLNPAQRLHRGDGLVGRLRQSRTSTSPPRATAARARRSR